jgi:CDP-glycerol glycerophosphotransferase (TagB/SpsB family)
MTFRSDRRDLSYSEITDLALSMPDSEKLKLAERLKKAGVKGDWEAIFRAFRAPKLDQRTINKAVKEVRAKRNGTKKRTATSTGR